MTRAIAVFFVGALASANAAWAQTPAPPPRVLFDVGAVVIGGSNAGKLLAQYTTPDGTPVTQFSIDRSVATAIGATSHLRINISKRVAVEVTGRWARHEFRSKLGGDTDGAENATATQSVDRFILGVGATVAVKQLGRWHTFARGNFGWLRELSDDQSLYQDGWNAELGGGANFEWTARHGHVRPYGIRADIWLDVRHGGLSFTERSRLLAPGFSASFIFKL